METTTSHGFMELLSIAEVAVLTGRKPREVRHWIDKGHLTRADLGTRRVYVRRSDLETFVARAQATKRR